MGFPTLNLQGFPTAPPPSVLRTLPVPVYNAESESDSEAMLSTGSRESIRDGGPAGVVTSIRGQPIPPTVIYVGAGNTPYGCTLCDKLFGRKDDAVRHARTHTGEKPFDCNYCDKTFAAKQSATRHELSHTGAKPHACTFCPKRFGRKDEAARHELTHKEEKPYGCAFCPKRFSRGSYAATHQQGHAEANGRPPPFPTVDEGQ